MLHSEFLQASWSANHHFNIENDWPDFCSSFITTEDSSAISFDSILSTLFSEEVDEFQSLNSNEQMSLLPVKSTNPQFIGAVEAGPSLGLEEVCRWYDESSKEEESPGLLNKEPDAEEPCISIESNEVSRTEQDFPWEEIIRGDDQRGLCHLLKAYGGAVENGYRELEEVIGKRILEKINPIGEAGERVAFHLLQPLETSGDYLREESSKNTEAAFLVFYQSFVYAMLAHFTANAQILEAMPDGIDRLHIIDFDMGEGEQWPPVIEALSSQKRVILKLTSIRVGDECNLEAKKFEEAKRRLYDDARSFGVELQVEQMNLDELMTELKRLKKRGKSRDWYAFNCMIGLPHMGRRPRRDHAMEFLDTAKVFLAEYTNHRGILTFGDGETGQNLENCSGFGSFFDGQFAHYQAIFNSMESNFPDYLAEARIAMESLFVAPFISSASWFEHWKKLDERFDFREGNMLEGRKLSKESIIEAKEMVNEANSSYKVKVEGERENEMVLEWKGTPLVRVSSWI